jgi:hypothetical protein
VYITEIHATDGWQVAENVADGVLIPQHESMQERVEVGETCMLKLALEMPAVADEMDDAVAKAYAGLPERLYLIGQDGVVAYKGGLGPMFFKPSEWEEAIETYLDRAAAS